MKSAFKVVGDIIRRQFLSGVLVVVPLILTYVVLRFLFEAIDGILSPYLEKFFHYSIPGLGIITTILIIILTGFFVRSIVGAWVYKYGDKFLAKMPIVRIFYLAAKQLMEALTIPQYAAFKEVVMFEYPRRGVYAIGFSTARIDYVIDDGERKKLVGIFVPSTPTPISGIVIFVPENDVIPINLTIEEGLKLLVSGGIVAPPEFSRKQGNVVGEVKT